MPSLKKIRQWASGARVSGLPTNSSFNIAKEKLEYDIDVRGYDAKLTINGKKRSLAEMGAEEPSVLDEIVFGDYPEDLKDVALYLIEENAK